MKRSILALIGALAAVGITQPAIADPFIQNVSGSNLSGAFVNLLDPSFGPNLQAVHITGTLSYGMTAVRSGSEEAISIPVAGTGQFIVASGSAGYFGDTPLTGFETCAVGQIFCSVGLSGNVDFTLTGADLFRFIGTGQGLINPNVITGPPPVGTLAFGPNAFFSLRVVYDVPEPSTWAMMLFGFFVLGLQVKHSRGRTIPQLS